MDLRSPDGGPEHNIPGLQVQENLPVVLCSLLTAELMVTPLTREQAAGSTIGGPQFYIGQYWL